MRATMCVLRLHTQKPFNIKCKTEVWVCVYQTDRKANDYNNFKGTD